MLYTLENDKLKIAVNDMGAELYSLYSKVTDTEYLWQGDAKYWKDRALNLFPFIGRMYEGVFHYEGKTYSSRMHGLCRYFLFRMEKQTENTLTFLLTDDEETHKEYPFAFEFRVTYLLEGARLTTRYEVTNNDSRTLICAFGGHPGINVPFGKGNFEDYYLEFSKGVTPSQQLLEEGKPYMMDKSVPYPLADGNKIPLKHELFLNDAIILEQSGGVVSLKSKEEKRYIAMHYEDFPFIGFWQAIQADTPYVCLEPWSALPAIDGKVVELETKPHMTHVPAGKTASKSFALEVHE